MQEGKPQTSYTHEKNTHTKKHIKKPMKGKGVSASRKEKKYRIKYERKQPRTETDR